MPFITADGIRHYFRLEGAAGAPVLMLSHALGLDHGMWEPQLADFLPHLQLLRYDTRGHGASDAPSGDYTIERLARDALAIADGAGVERFAFCGLSLGGMVGQRLALLSPERLTHLVLANTSPKVSDPNAMELRRRAVLDGGMGAVLDVVMGRFFTPAVRDAGGAGASWARRTLLATDPTGYAGCCAAIRDMDHSRELPSIATPTLVIAGDADISMPRYAHGALLVDAIPHARGVRLPAAHMTNLEMPRSFTVCVLEFLLPPADGTVERGMPIRRAVLGDAHVDRSQSRATDFTRDFQDLITRFAWGTIWARPGLNVRTRRLVVMATTAALGRWEEFRLHVRSGLAAELEPVDLEELLLQLAVYAGVPAANTAFQIAQDEIEAHEPSARD